MHDLTERLARLSPEQRALLEARLKAKGLAAPRPGGIAPIPGRETMEHFPCSFDQERLWFIDQMEPGNPAYNIHTTTRLRGPLDLDRMRRAVNRVIARHEVLRTTFQVVDEQPVQVVAPRLEIDLPVVDLTGVPETAREEAARRVSTEAASVRFDLATGPLVQVVMGRLAEDDHVMMVCMQHAVTDRWSFDVFENEVGQAYVALGEGREPELPHLPVQFADFAAWQREELSGERGRRHVEYWRNKLGDAPMVLEIPTDRPRPPVQTFAGAREYVTYSPELLRKLKALTRECGATMFMTILAGLDLVCWKYSGQRDLVIGSAIVDRNRPETENVIGYFLNMLLLRATIDPAMSFRDLLAQGKETALGAYAHQDVPFATLVSELKPRQDASRNPLMQVSFIYLDFELLSTPEDLGFASSSIDVDNGASRFDLTLACWELPEGIHSYIEYNTDLYDGAKISGMLTHLGRILEQVADAPDRPLSGLDILDDGERRELLRDFQPAEPPREECLHAPVDAAAARPEAEAIVHAAGTTTFGELSAAADRIAAALRAHGVGAGDLVPLRAERSVEQAAALLGILRSGAAYVPLDPALPDERTAAMIAPLDARVLLAQESLRDVPGADAPVLAIEEILRGDGTGTPATVAGSGAAPLPAAVAGPEAAPLPAPRVPGPRFAIPRDPAYVMFTSGSTGVPKGVVVPHRAIANRVRWSQDRYPVRPGDRVLHNASFAFDIAAWELIGPLGAGAAVVIPREGEHRDPAALVRLIREERITVAHFVPSLLRTLLAEPDFAGCDSLRMVLCGGEALDRELHDRFHRTLPGRTLAHFYGPTEAAISCLFHDCAPDLPPGPVPLGRPVTGMRAYVLDDTLRPVPRGIPGEVFLGGIGLADGYLRRPDLTAERFVPDPFSGEPGARLYRTGDRAKHRADGTLEFLGRTDHQIKIRGTRIEPGEIETTLEAMPGVRRAVATARGRGVDQRLVAYVETDGDAPAPAEAEMRTVLRSRLPEAMVPAAFVVLDALPLNANGKIDRASLPEPGAAAESEAPWVAPRTPTEEAIAETWKAVLRRDRVGALDDFFDLGGDSLLATQVVARLRSAFSIELPLRRFFEGSTVQALAAAVEEGLVERLATMSDDDATRELAGLRPPPAGE
jgi:amino acid adenylation domain-containing protein